MEYRTLGRTELSLIAEIDRSEHINVLYEQHGTQLVARHGTWSASAWDPDGHGEDSVEAKVHQLQHYFDKTAGSRSVRSSAGGWSESASPCHTLRPGSRSRHVSAPFGTTAIGSRPSEQLEQIARTAGDSDMVVSATPSENTVRFYLGRGFQPMADPLTELFELEPEDVHMRKML